MYRFEDVKDPLERLLKRIEHDEVLFPERITAYNISVVALEHQLEQEPKRWGITELEALSIRAYFQNYNIEEDYEARLMDAFPDVVHPNSESFIPR